MLHMNSLNESAWKLIVKPANVNKWIQTVGGYKLQAITKRQPDENNINWKLKVHFCIIIIF